MHAQEKQKGLIGITVNTGWFVPLSDTKRDQDAAQRAMDFNYGWYVRTNYFKLTYVML